jgi:hypothetical protein
MDTPGIEPGAFRLQSERDTTTPHTLIKFKYVLFYLKHFHKINLLINFISSFLIFILISI